MQRKSIVVSLIYLILLIGDLDMSFANTQIKNNSINTVEKIIKSEYHKLIEIITNSTTSDNIKIAKIKKMSEKRIDFALITKLCIGKKYWSILTDEQKKQLNLSFKLYLQNFYIDLVLKNSDKTAVFLPAIENKNKVIMPIIIDQEYNIKYKLYQKNNSWKIYDLEIEGISFLNTYRMQFATYLSKLYRVEKSDFKQLGEGYQEVYNQLLRQNIIVEETDKIVFFLKSDQPIKDKLNFLDDKSRKVILQLLIESETHFNQLIQHLK